MEINDVEIFTLFMKNKEVANRVVGLNGLSLSLISLRSVISEYTTTFTDDEYAK